MRYKVKSPPLRPLLLSGPCRAPCWTRCFSQRGLPRHRRPSLCPWHRCSAGSLPPSPSSSCPRGGVGTCLPPSPSRLHLEREGAERRRESGPARTAWRAPSCSLSERSWSSSACPATAWPAVSSPKAPPAPESSNSDRTGIGVRVRCVTALSGERIVCRLVTVMKQK